MNSFKTQMQAMVVCLLLFFSSLVLAQDLTNKVDSVSYSFGLMIGQNLAKEGLKEVNPDILAKAIADQLKGNTALMNTNEAQAYYTAYRNEVKLERTKAARALGEAYLAENAKKPGVITTDSGLQYEVLVRGDGPMPTAKDKVKTHYHGTLIDGTVFDSSVERGKPISFPVMGVIKGWQEALQLMHVGDKLRLTIPYNLAYGERGSGQKIPPFSTLVFEVELLDIE